MAEGLLRHALKGRPDVAVASAGVSAVEGQPASPESVQSLKSVGIDISNHRSRRVNKEIVQKATCILAMTQAHVDTILRYFPEAAEKTLLVRDFDDSAEAGDRDILDPIGLGQPYYDECRDVIISAIPGILKFIDQTDHQSSMTPATATQAPAATSKITLSMGADHGGIALRESLLRKLKEDGHEVIDHGATGEESVDYPDYATLVTDDVANGRAQFGILICRTGIGMSIAANRNPAVRAAVVTDPETAAIVRQHNDANILCLGGSKTTPTAAAEILDSFLSAKFEGGRHARRVGKMSHVVPAEVLRVDPEVAEAIAHEQRRQSENIELIASENFTSRAVMEAQGSCLTNKYAEGYPGRRWYGGCEHVDIVEQLAIDRAKELFGAEHANVQPHSGSQANMAVYFSVLSPGDRILTMDLAHGGHLTHGHRANFSGKLYEVSHYGVAEDTGMIDYEALARQAEEFRPRMITVGASAYPRIIDFARMREIADSVGAYLFADMAHIAGLVAGGVHPSPVPHADFVTTTTHKSLRGPRGGLILCREEYAKKVDAQTFPGIQGGPLMHVIAAKAVCLHEALQPGFRAYAAQVVSNAKALSARLAMLGCKIVSGGTDNHVMLVDLRPLGLSGKQAQEALDVAGITVNKNAIPYDTMPITQTGGIRIGTPAATTRGMKEEEMMEIGDLIYEVLTHHEDTARLESVKSRVRGLTSRFPLP